MGGVRLIPYKVGWRMFTSDTYEVVGMGTRVIHASSAIVAQEQATRRMTQWHPPGGLTARNLKKILIGIRFCRGPKDNK